MTEKENPHGLAAKGAVDNQDGSTSQSQPANARLPRESYNSLLRDVTRDYIASLDPDNWPDAEMFERGLMEDVLGAVLMRNSAAPKEDRWRAPHEMIPAMVAMALMVRGHYIRLDFSDGAEQDTAGMPLYFYDHESGLYKECDSDILGRQVRSYKFSATKGFIEEVEACLREEAPIRTRTRDANLDVVNNGIRNRTTGELMPFSPEYVFTTKTAINWVDNPPLPICVARDGWQWNWLDAVSEMMDGDPEMVELMRSMIAAALRPNVRWDVAFFFYSKTGNNGKGTICQVIRNLLGQGNHTSIPFADFNNNRYMLGALTRVQAVICDENQVGKYADDNAEFKAAVTNDVIPINRKYKPVITARFHGTIFQCVNEVPKIRDRSDSFWRRIVPVYFPACFTGKERREVKHDFICRPEVLEYIQWWALTMDIDEIKIPQKCLDLMQEFKAESNPVLDFFEEVYPRFRWQAVPAQLVYDMYKDWHKQNGGGGNPMQRRRFYSEIGPLFEAKGCNAFDVNVKFASAKYMRGEEPMILEYGCERWMPRYKGPDRHRMATPEKLARSYSGWLFPEQRPNGAAGDDDA